jgi:predicted GTPase
VLSLRVIREKTTGSLSVKIVHEASIDELQHTAPQFLFLKNIHYPGYDRIRWKLDGVDVSCVQVMFIGKTGYGKSTTLNKICGGRFFETNDIDSCTKQLFSSEYKIDHSGSHRLSFCDLPGIGESLDTDKEYIRLYSKMFDRSACVVYIMRADQRDFSDDKKLIESFLKIIRRNIRKLIVGINYSDKVEPVTRGNFSEPSQEQKENLKRKMESVSGIFDIENEKIVCYSASEGYNLNLLLEKISTLLKSEYHEPLSAKDVQIWFDKVSALLKN